MSSEIENRHCDRAARLIHVGAGDAGRDTAL